MSKTERTIRVGKDISIINFLKTRILTPKEIVNGIKNPIFPNSHSVGDVLFSARYNANKAIEGYDFV